MKIDPDYAVEHIYSRNSDGSLEHKRFAIIKRTSDSRMRFRLIIEDDSPLPYTEMPDKSEALIFCPYEAQLRLSNNTIQVNGKKYLIIARVFYLDGYIIARATLLNYFRKLYRDMSWRALVVIAIQLRKWGWLKKEADDLVVAPKHPFIWYIKPFGRRLW